MLEHKSFRSENDAKEWISKNYHSFINDVQNKIGHEERCFADIINEYGGIANKVYNDFLRCVKGNEELLLNSRNNPRFSDLIKDIEVLKFIISEHPLKDNVLVFRYPNLPFWELFKLLFNQKGYKYTEYGFMSTTLLPYSEGMIDFADRESCFVLFKIMVPKGTPTIPLEFNENQTRLKEHEMLFMPGSKLELIRKYLCFKTWRPLIIFELILIK